MIDGVKINCIGTPPEKWLNNPLLNFCSKVNQQTGEVLSKTQIAFYKGLQFTITPSIIDETGFVLSFRGSLASFYNEGKNNAFDFDISMLSEVISELNTKFHIDPNRAKITAFEFGANIEPHQKANKIIQSLRAYGCKKYIGLKMENVFCGQLIDKNDTSFKVYNKSLQASENKTNLLRVEYALNYSKTVNKYNFHVLNDLVNESKLNNIKPILLETWRNSIFYDTGMKWREMSQKEREKMLYYLDANNWINFKKMQRKRAKTNFQALYSKFCTSSTQTDILQLLSKKLDILTAEKCYLLQDIEKSKRKPNENPKMLPFTALDEVVNSNQNISKKHLKKIPKKTKEISQKTLQKKCCVCKRDISHKKLNTVYCSKHCNNSNQAKKRKLQRHKQKKAENKNLAPLLEKLDKSNLNLTIEYRDKGKIDTHHLKQSELKVSQSWIMKVSKVIINKPKQMTFTGWNAKRIIRTISVHAPP